MGVRKLRILKGNFNGRRSTEVFLLLWKRVDYMKNRGSMEGYRRWVLLWQDVLCGDAFLNGVSADIFSILVDRRATVVSYELMDCCSKNEVSWTKARLVIEIYRCIVSIVTWWSWIWYCWGCYGWRLVKLQALEVWNFRGRALDELAPQWKCSFVYTSVNGMGRDIWSCYLRFFDR